MYTSSLGVRIRLARKERGLSQGGVAELLGVTAPAVSQWETGTTIPSTQNLLDLSKTFGASFAVDLASLETPTANTGNANEAERLRAKASALRARAAELDAQADRIEGGDQQNPGKQWRE